LIFKGLRARRAWYAHCVRHLLIFQAGHDLCASKVPNGAMAEIPTTIRDVAQEIRRYLAAHPNASDTVEGVQAWWLPNRVPKATVKRALDVLAADEVVHRRKLPDGNHIYVAGPPRRGDPADS
jgi:hypothetical protein